MMRRGLEVVGHFMLLTLCTFSMRCVVIECLIGKDTKKGWIDGPQSRHLALYAGSLGGSEHLQKRASVCTSIAMSSNYHYNL
jgi:hypothetical protein